MGLGASCSLAPWHLASVLRHFVQLRKVLDGFLAAIRGNNCGPFPLPVGSDEMASGPAIATHSLNSDGRCYSMSMYDDLCARRVPGFATKKPRESIVTETSLVTLGCFFGCFRAACGIYSSATNQSLAIIIFIFVSEDGTF